MMIAGMDGIKNKIEPARLLSYALGMALRRGAVRKHG
jgi:hypothetical protein